MTKKRALLYACLNSLGVLATLVVNALANALPINGKNTGELSDLYPNLFVPAGITFSIWGIIYLLLVLFCIYQFFSVKKGATDYLKRIKLIFFISCAANCAWILAWHYQMVGLSLVVMLILLACLLFLYLGLKVGKPGTSKAEVGFIHLPVSVYLGWITIATIANITALLVNLGWNGFGLEEQLWTALAIMAGTLITLGVVFSRGDLFYSLVVLWAFSGIILKRLQTPEEPSKLIITVLAVGIILIVLALGVVLSRKGLYGRRALNR